MNLPPRHSRSLPEPDTDALAHSASLVGHIRNMISDEGGQIGFDRFMQEALYAPGKGYYVSGTAKFGGAGDFTTAPEVSAVFGQCLAQQCAEIMQASGGHILELGAGTGKLAVDVLNELARLDCMPASYQIMEVSADLRERQSKALATHINSGDCDIRWLDALPDSPFAGVLIANEVLDALPVRCFGIGEGEGKDTGSTRVYERTVVTTECGFGWGRRAADENLLAAVENIEHALGTALPPGYQSEVSLGLTGWLASVLRCISKGAAIFSDYGLPRRQYYLQERDQGTLVCHYRHRVHDNPFMYVGLQDISAWVDFTALAEAADEAGWTVAGFTTQAHFLIGSGLQTIMTSNTSANMREQLQLASEVKTLTLPGEMGERFKFMALTNNFNQPLSGFEIQDMRGAL